MPAFDPVLNLAALDGSNGFRIDGAAAGDWSGYSVNQAGDVNGDGFADIIIGAKKASPNGFGSGSSYVVFGTSAGFNPTFDLSNLDGSNGFRIDGAAFLDFSGHSVSAAGDINGDGLGDLIIGALGTDTNGPSSGSSYVVFGSDGGFAATLSVSSLDGSNGFRIDGVAAYDISGVSVSGAGDVNGDGFDDLIVGAQHADPNGTDSGSNYVVFGSATGFGPSLELSSLNGSNGFRIDGEAALDESGVSVSAAGDINGDGIDDLLVGAMHAGPSGAGAAYVVFGTTAGFSSALALSSLDGSNGFRMDGITFDDLTGVSLGEAGDVNGDGIGDLIIGAPGHDANGYNSGSSYVVFGSSSGFAPLFDLSGLDGSNGFRIDGIAAYDGSGNAVSSAGDINGDGFGDLIIGAYSASPSGAPSGAAYVVFGGTGFAATLDLSSLDGSNGFRLDGVAAGDLTGVSVSAAGDVNGDGFDDLIVGAPGADPNGLYSGSTYIVFGHSNEVSQPLAFQHPFDSDSFVFTEARDGDGWHTRHDFAEVKLGNVQDHSGHVHYYLGEDWVPERGSALEASIHAVADGRVVFADEHPVFGKVIVIEHDVSANGLDVATVYSLYAHLDHIDFAEVGDGLVAMGDQIGSLGNSGETHGNHLHLEIFSANWEDYLSGDLGLYGYADAVPGEWYDPTNFISEFVG